MNSKNAQKRPYGKAPLELSLEESLDVLQRIVAQAGRLLSASKLAAILGNTVTSSAFGRKARALSLYGLLTQQGESYALTELALAIAHPRSRESQAEATTEAFLRVEQFSFLFHQHKGKLLPADEFLRNIIEQEFVIPRETSDVWVRQFKDGAKASGLFHIRSDGKIQIAESPILDAPIQGVEEAKDLPRTTSEEVSSDPRATVVSSQRSNPSRILQVVSGHNTRIELSDGRYAEITIPDSITQKDAQKLQRALDGIKVIIESMISE